MSDFNVFECPCCGSEDSIPYDSDFTNSDKLYVTIRMCESCSALWENRYVHAPDAQTIIRRGK